MPRPCHARAGAGFTLIELLVAITLLAVIAVIAWRGLDSMMRTSERLSDHDTRLNHFKLLYGQFQADCEHLASPDALLASPVAFGDNLLLMVRDRREEGQPTAWQVVAYRLDGTTVVRAASPAVDNRDSVRGALQALRQPAQPGQGGQGIGAPRPLVGDTVRLGARAWIDPDGWQADSGRVETLLMTNRRAPDTPPASGVAGEQPGAALRVVKAVELTVQARMGDGDSPRQFQKICMTGL